MIAQHQSASAVRLDDCIPHLDYNNLAPDLTVFLKQRVRLQVPGTTLYFYAGKVGKNWVRAPSIGRLWRGSICSISFADPVYGDIEKFVDRAVRITLMNGLQATMKLEKIDLDATEHELLVLGHHRLPRYLVHALSFAG